MKTICTIITSDYFPRALALYNSVKLFQKNIIFHVLIADNKELKFSTTANEQVKISRLDDLAAYPLVKSLHTKYAHINFDNFRWSLKPVYAGFLLETGYEKLIYVDCDMFFVNDYTFLFNDLDDNDILLTPNWNSTNPLNNQSAFLSNFTSGLFSAGFFGVNKTGLPAMTWWAHACHFMMGEHIKEGVNDDQRYLDIFPVLFEKTKIIRHRGCNIGSWNYEESKRTLINGELLINGKYPVIFIHFDEMLVSTILKGHDKLLLPYLEKYKRTFETNGYKLEDFISSCKVYADPNLLLKLKWHLHIKKRLKRWLYKIAELL